MSTRLSREVWPIDQRLMPPFMTQSVSGPMRVEYMKPDVSCDRVIVSDDALILKTSIGGSGCLFRCSLDNPDHVDPQGIASFDEVQVACVAFRFELAVRTGDPIAVAVHGLILFVLSRLTEAEQKRTGQMLAGVEDATTAAMISADAFIEAHQ